MAKCCRSVAGAVLALAFAAWAVFFSGVASLHSACRKDELPVPARILLFNASSIPGHESCAWQQGWQWLVVFGQLAWLIAAAVALFSARAARAALPALALLAVWTTFIMPLCNSYLALHYNLSDAGLHASAWLTARATECCVAGTLIASIANVILLVILGCRVECAAQGDSCSKPAASSAAPPAVNVHASARSGADPNSSAFIDKTEAAAAAGAMV
ncbi:hypothetical protein ABPG75_002537 [Micractinium tetrahymenae]